MRIRVNRNHIAVARLAQGWSVQELAKHAKATVTTIYDLESGRRTARVSTLKKVCNTLGLKIEDVIIIDASDDNT